jgi:hypothetical protein
MLAIRPQQPRYTEGRDQPDCIYQPPFPGLREPITKRVVLGCIPVPWRIVHALPSVAEDQIEPTCLIAEPVAKESQSAVSCLQVCERRDGKGKMTNVMASKRCAYLQLLVGVGLAGDLSQLVKYRDITRAALS